MPLIPNLLERLFLRSQPQLAAFLDIWGAGAFEAVEQAVRAGILDAIRDGVVTPQGIAERIRADERGTAILLEMLEAFGYLRRKRDGRYSLTRVAEGFSKNPTMVSQDTFKLYGHLYTFWRENEDSALRSGEPQVNAFKWFDRHPEVWKLFHSFELGLAKGLGPKAAKAAMLPVSARKLLDIGGGHGMYSVAFCRQYRNLRAVVFDSPRPLEDARVLIESEGMSDRVTVREGDFLEDDLGSGFDAAFLSNIVHLFRAETNKVLLRKVAATLNAGGRIIILDQLKGGELGRTLKAVHAFYGLIFLITTGGQLYTYAELSELLADSGFTSIRRKRMPTSGNDLVLATKAA